MIRDPSDGSVKRKRDMGPSRFRTIESMLSWLNKPEKGPSIRRMSYRHPSKPVPGKWKAHHR